ncbi:MAG: NTP transferase domain-containing protein [Chloroflexi bacterium]|nr:NTP transferase domain-containing protein [Chloroflexota bacterium]
MEQAIILAAGEGQRLRPLTVHRPKVMLPIGNKPILQYVLEAVASFGIRRVVVVVGYRKEQVKDYFGSGEKLGLDIKYVEQKKQLGTAHALLQAREPADEVFLVLSGDNIISPATIEPLLALTSPTILVKPQKDVSKYGVVTVEKGRAVGIVEKPVGDTEALANTGIYVLTKDILASINGEVDLPSVLNAQIEQGKAVAVQETEDDWLDVVYPWDMLKLNATLLTNVKPETAGVLEPGVSIRGKVEIGEGSIIRSGSYLVGPLVIGKNCEIGPHSCLFPATSIGDNVVVSPFCYVRNSVVFRDVQLGPYSCLEDSVCGEGTRIAGQFLVRSAKTVVYVEEERHVVTMGAVIGERCQLGAGIVVKAGTTVGNDCRVQSMKLLQDNIEDGSLVA